MPKMGISVSEGTIVEWRKQPGDWVEADETVADVTTDKIDVEIPSPATGRLARLIAEPARPSTSASRSPRSTPARSAGEAHPKEARDHRRDRGRSGCPGRGRRDEVDRSRFFSPVVRRIADKHGVDLDQVEGTGIGGRVRKKDVLAYVEARRQRQAEARRRPSTASRRTGPTSRRRRPSRRPRPSAAASAREPMSTMRQAIARHMVQSRQTAAHCTTIVEVDMSRVAARRSQLKEPLARKGVPLTYLAFVAVATVEALERHPVLNASVDGDDARLPRRRQPRDRGGARRGADRPGDPAGAAAQPRGDGGGDRRRRRARAGQAARRPTTSTAARSRSPTRASSAPCSRRRSSTSRRWRSSTSRRSSSGRSSSRTRTAASRSRSEPMTYLPMSWDHRALDGAEAAKFLAPGQGPARGLGGGVTWASRLRPRRNGAAAARRGAARWPARSLRSRFDHEQLAVRRGERSGLYSAVAIHSTALGPALGGLRIWHYAEPADARRATRCAWPPG